MESPKGSGRWRLRVFAGTDPMTGKPRQMSKTVAAKNKTAAQAILKTWQREIGDSPKPGSTATVRVVLDEFLAFKSGRGASPTTLYTDRHAADQIICPELGDIPICDLTVRHIDVWQGHLLSGIGRLFATEEAKVKATRNGRLPKLEPASARRHFAVLSAALSKAHDWGWVNENICERAQAPAAPSRSVVAPTIAQVTQLLDHAYATNPSWAVLLTLALVTGARRGEVCALRWNDIEYASYEDEEWALIRYHRTPWRAGPERGEKEGLKGKASEKTVTVEPGVTTFLKDWRTRCEYEAMDKGLSLVPDAFVVSPFPDGGRPVNPDSFGSAVSRWCDELKMPHVHLHSQRHFAATRMSAEGIDVRDIAEILGHADGGRLVLRTYAHGDAAVQRRAARVLGQPIVGRALPERSGR